MSLARSMLAVLRYTSPRQKDEGKKKEGGVRGIESIMDCHGCVLVRLSPSCFFAIRRDKRAKRCANVRGAFASSGVCSRRTRTRRERERTKREASKGARGEGGREGEGSVRVIFLFLSSARREERKSGRDEARVRTGE